jgi:pilus assembly protein Flp/PilA
MERFSLWMVQLVTGVQSRVYELKNQDGQTLVEYALIIALVSVGLIAALTTLRTQIEGVFTAIGTALAGA